MDQRHRRQNFNLRHPRHPRQNFMDDTLPTPPTSKSEPRHPRTHAATQPRYPRHQHDLADFFFNIDAAYTDFLLTKLLQAKR